MSSHVTEQQRLNDAREAKIPWKKWGPYLSERQWGTVREDYSKNGDAWNFFTHDHARSRAYRWGEDGLGGISDDKQHLCFALALWNGKDPILKERLFGLTNSEGNHGEDVKEYYFYLDSTPTHSYMKFLYKYAQAAYPYADLVETNRRRSRNDFEYELLDTGAFNEDRYFDVFMEYAKASPEDILIQITAHNRGPEEALLHVLPTLWFRNDWATWISRPAEKPMLRQIEGPVGTSSIAATHDELGAYHLYCEGTAPLLFTENSTNHAKLHLDYPDVGPYLKDGINDYVVEGRREAVNPERQGTKAAAHYRLTVGPGGSATVRLRLTPQAPAGSRPPETGRAVPFGEAFDETLAARQREADAFYKSVTPPSISPDATNVMRQALAGMLWSKQYYYWDGDAWLEEHFAHPLHHGRRDCRNREWFHMVNDDIISMPDKWEYPWYAAWDLAFHTLPLSIVDPDFAKLQMELMLRGRYLHPSGQVPAYEWNFSDVNPPVHAWATLFLHRTEQALRGETDVDFLKLAFHKLLLNYTWWVNRKDGDGNNVFEGGFLGLDNIGVFDRSAPLPTGGYMEQADGTAWMALFTQNMMELAAELTSHDRTYEDMVFKFIEHFLFIAAP
jgi:mannosylglycerate hydrolase MGH1-like protein